MARILIIDDDPVQCEILVPLLTDVGHDVTTARDGQEGLAVFMRFTPDLVITDLIMPEREGIETIREMRRLSPSVAIVAISASDRYLNFAQAFGAALVFVKPLDLSVFAAAVESLLTPAPPNQISSLE